MIALLPTSAIITYENSSITFQSQFFSLILLYSSLHRITHTHTDSNLSFYMLSTVEHDIYVLIIKSWRSFFPMLTVKIHYTLKLFP